MPTPYISLGDLTIFMQVTPGSLSAALGQLSINAAMASVRKYLDQEITWHANDAVQLDGTGTDALRLPQRPVVSVAEVKLDGTVIAATEYFRRGSILYLPSSWPYISSGRTRWNRGRGNIFVTYSHGYCVETPTDSDFSDSAGDFAGGCSGETVPADIILVTLSAARRGFETAGQEDTSALGGETIGSYSYTLLAEKIASATELVLAERRVLAGYRIKKVV